jgi:quinol monooxygenase YgiN
VARKQREITDGESKDLPAGRTYRTTRIPDDVKGALKQALIPALQEAGCEGIPHKLVFFENFSSSAAHKFHLEQDYMKRLFYSIGGQVGRSPDHDQVENTLARSRSVQKFTL